MKIIYHCYGGAHSSVTAAAIHTGKISHSHLPTDQELMSVPYFDQQEKGDHGRLKLMGVDEFGNEVYVVGKRHMGRVYENFVRGVAGLLGIPEAELVLVDTMPYVNWRMMVGGYTSRRLRLTAIGRPIVLSGTRGAYFKLSGLVNTVKTKLSGR